MSQLVFLTNARCLRERPLQMISRRSRLSALGGPRARLLALAVSITVVVGIVVLPAAQAAPSLDTEELEFCRIINSHRAQYGLQPLLASTRLNAAADWLSTDMANKNYAPSNHVDSQGRGPIERMLAFGYPANSSYVAENIAGGNSTAEATFSQWRSSSSHNANMLDSRFKVIGIGRAPNSASLYDWYWTTDFGAFIDSGATPCSTSATPSPPPAGTPSPIPTGSPSSTPPPPSNPPATPTVVASPSTVSPGRVLQVSWSGVTNPSPYDWVGLYPSSSTPDFGDVAWRHTTGTSSGTVALQVPAATPPGTTYQIRLFRNDTYTRLATFGPLAVSGGASVSLNPATVNAGGVFQVTWSGVTSPSPYDWIGLYPSSGTANSADIAWRYTTGASSGTVSLKVPSGTPPGTTYQIRLFRNDTYTRLATSGPLTVVQATVSVNPTSANAGDSLQVSWSGVIAPSPNDWVGLYPSPGSSNYFGIAWRYTNGASSGTLSLRVPPGTPPGTTYQIRLFRNNTYSRLASSGSLTVK